MKNITILRERLQFRPPRSNNHGSILIVSLWILTILSLFSISVSTHVRQKISFAERIERRNWFAGLAELGVYEATAQLKKNEEPLSYNTLSNPWAADEKLFRHVKVGDGSYTVQHQVLGDNGEIITRYGVTDEESKVNLNKAPAAIIAALFEVVAGVNEEEASVIAYSIVDWRDADTSLSHPVDGAEDDYYDELEMSYEAKDAEFKTIYEVLLVRGMTQEIFEKVKRYITIYGNGYVNLNTASKPVLLALGLDEDLIEKIFQYRRGTDQEEATPDDRAFTQAAAITAEITRVESLSGSEIAALSNLVAAGNLGVVSNAFMVQSRGESFQKKAALDLTVVIDGKGAVLSWFTGIPRRMTPQELTSIETYTPKS